MDFVYRSKEFVAFFVCQSEIRTNHIAKVRRECSQIVGSDIQKSHKIRKFDRKPKVQTQMTKNSPTKFPQPNHEPTTNSSMKLTKCRDFVWNYFI